MPDIEVVYALPERQALYRVTVEEGATVRDAIEASGVLRDFPDIDLSRNRVGVYARLVALETPLRAGDRVEIYRPLQADPKTARRARAAAQRGK
ncbi:MAG TPA: RnfH family protein [Burkholderiales bacterium]|nr:RnfH family protein [Burkholderiales bacterium]